MAERSKAREWMFKHDWDRAPDGSLRDRLYHLTEPRKWWDWGNRVMILVGREWCGSFDVPRGRDMWYRSINGGKSRGKFETTYEYTVVRDRPDDDWKVFDVQNDGFDIMMGYWPTGHGNISFYGLDRSELNLFLRWLLFECKIRGEWFGVRRWLYYKALHAAVEKKIPFTCQVTPDRNSGGYSHWHCQLKKRHKGDHRYVSYTWAGPGAQVEYEPMEATDG